MILPLKTSIGESSAKKITIYAWITGISTFTFLCISEFSFPLPFDFSLWRTISQCEEMRIFRKSLLGSGWRFFYKEEFGGRCRPQLSGGGHVTGGVEKHWGEGWNDLTPPNVGKPNRSKRARNSVLITLKKLNAKQTKSNYSVGIYQNKIEEH